MSDYKNIQVHPMDNKEVYKFKVGSKPKKRANISILRYYYSENDWIICVIKFICKRVKLKIF